MPTTGPSTRVALAAAALMLSAWMTACSASPAQHASPTTSKTGSATAAPTTTPTPVPTATPTPALTASWPVYHQNPERTGQSAATPALTTLATAWSTNLDGAVWAQPIVVGGNVIVATENDTLYSLNPASGTVVWQDHVGTPVPRADLPCGNIFPLGMTGTPAYDPATQSIFVVAEETGPIHVLYDFDAISGAVLWSRQVDISNSLEHPSAVQQRPALTVANGYVYVGFGGLDGDCSQYVGAVAAVPTSNQGATLDFMVPTSREGAVWATGGPVVGPNSDIFVATGNGAAEGGTWDESDSVLELSPTLQLVSDWAPARWAYDNAHDLDLGSVAPTLLPDGYVFIAGKSGIGYVLQESALGGVGGEVYSHQVCGGRHVLRRHLLQRRHPLPTLFQWRGGDLGRRGRELLHRVADVIRGQWAAGAGRRQRFQRRHQQRDALRAQCRHRRHPGPDPVGSVPDFASPTLSVTWRWWGPAPGWSPSPVPEAPPLDWV